MKRRFEFLFLFVLMASLYIVLLTDCWLWVKAVAAAVYLLIIGTSMVSLMLENRTAQITLVWMYALLFFPVIGYAFYLYSGQLYIKGYLFRSKRAHDRDEWQLLLRSGEPEEAPDLKPSHKAFAQYAQRVSFSSMDTGTRTHILKNGEETFAEIMRRLGEARQFIHIEYYIFRSDRLGQRIIGLLIDKAREGVEVRFMYDALGGMSLQGKDIAAMKEAGISVHAFLPIKLGFFNQKFNFRNHRKIIVIDGHIGFVGGLNVGVEYLGQNESIGFWRDTHMMLEGSAVRTLHAVFLLDWNYVCQESLLKEKRYLQAEPVLGERGAVHVVASGPDTQQGIMSDLYYTMIASASTSVWIATPYFVPNEAIRTALRVAANRGVQVRIIVPEISDSFLTEYATKSYFPELLRSGVEIYMYQKGFLHQKIVIVDGDLASVGTANMDMRSFHLNFEVNVFLLGTDSIADLVRQYEEDLEDSLRVMPVQFYKRGLKARGKESFARLFSGVL
ncbi:cardiolipin synthase [Paenibacillus sp. UNCCL117]|uniref:cardiolipin synthase n=1 Tax=unclassified Paenibacillus TaxID=185978 RepID=UPI000888070E|nr:MULTISPECIES: cardiolipin synthase [unclassified Paenibacillus]SDC92246.1 cardiolipin synthase [Paenibacillus sp. cl123]SFW29296.1 cardiolipin synthase [Paenibacillus sp. UNCCL117]